MDIYQQLITNAEFAGTVPASVPLPSISGASLYFENQSPYGFKVMDLGQTIQIDYIEPYGFLQMPYKPSLGLAIDTKSATLQASTIQYVGVKFTDGVLPYSKGSLVSYSVVQNPNLIVGGARPVSDTFNFPNGGFGSQSATTNVIPNGQMVSGHSVNVQVNITGSSTDVFVVTINALALNAQGVSVSQTSFGSFQASGAVTVKTLFSNQQLPVTQIQVTVATIGGTTTAADAVTVLVTLNTQNQEVFASTPLPTSNMALLKDQTFNINVAPNGTFGVNGNTQFQPSFYDGIIVVLESKNKLAASYARSSFDFYHTGPYGDTAAYTNGANQFTSTGIKAAANGGSLLEQITFTQTCYGDNVVYTFTNTSAGTITDTVTVKIYGFKLNAR